MRLPPLQAVRPGDGGARVIRSAELDMIVRMVAARDPGLVSVGHGAGSESALESALESAPESALESALCATAFAERWRERGGTIGAIVSWPESAASWLRPATRFAAGAPDLWVVADGPRGWAGMGPRLVADGRWDPRRTIAFAGLADPRLPDECPLAAVDGLSGAAADGTCWMFAGRDLIRVPEPPR